jgi:uncharacterized protein
VAGDPSQPTPVYQVVEGYGPARFRISGEVYETSVIVFPELTIEWQIPSFEELTPSDFAPIMEAPEVIEILLLGCGTRMELVPRSLRDPLRAAGIVIEPMDSGAAARTYNVLLSEDRRVAAALIALPN